MFKITFQSTFILALCLMVVACSASATAAQRYDVAPSYSPHEQPEEAEDFSEGGDFIGGGDFRPQAPKPQTKETTDLVPLLTAETSTFAPLPSTETPTFNPLPLTEPVTSLEPTPAIPSTQELAPIILEQDNEPATEPLDPVVPPVSDSNPSLVFFFPKPDRAAEPSPPVDSELVFSFPPVETAAALTLSSG